MRTFHGPHLRNLPLLAVLVAAALSGCAAGQMGNMWRDETFQTPGLKNVLVVTLRKDAMRRRLWEDSFAGGLAAYGARATPSYRLWPDAVPDTQQVIDAVRQYGYDGVLVNMRRPNSQEETWTPGYTRREAVTRLSPFTGAYNTYWKEVEVPPSTETTVIVNFQTDLWATGGNGRLVWSGETNTTDRGDASTIHHQTDGLILPELARSGLLAAKTRK
ncbi:MAG TPA: hypothetical protein VMH61_04265 [Candidatus Acidoferrales bacterium]|nr:hypothetical protein [Candidatus Acidoferrales bacterium]